MKKLLPFVAAALVFLPACSKASQIKFKTLKVRTVDTYGYLHCDFDATINTVEAYMRRGWKIQSEIPVSYLASSIGFDNQTFHCQGSHVVLYKYE
jgi:hypothetical protein